MILFSLVELPCSKKMQDGGVVPRSKLDVTKVEGKKETTFTVMKPTGAKDTPQWDEIAFTPTDNVKEVQYTPVDKKGTPTGEPTTVKLADAKKPFDSIKFDEPQTADGFVVVIVFKSAKPTDTEVVSAVVCTAAEGKYSASHLQNEYYCTMNPDIILIQQNTYTFLGVSRKMFRVK